ncbi:hypothetical protein BJ944DRAFT_257516 [Cunninghamella echinulata]|nr:hypothetical protein BJ944DRAFT_257516 [Cunninghamella echinulata]
MSLLRTHSSLLFKKKSFQVSVTATTQQQSKLFILPNALIQKSLRYHGSHHHHGSHSDHVHTDIVSTLKTSGKRGMQITLVGLVANVGLTISKGIGGWYMNSASLLADATHSLSGKFETIGSFAVSTLLLSGGVAIGLHSFELLTTVIESASASTTPAVMETVSTVASSSIETAASTSSATSASTASATTDASSSSHSHGSIFSFLEHHHHSNVLDPNAAWFALASVLIKEWLYHATIKVGKSEHSDVLIANAWHHRSDAFSSVIALVAIVGSHFGLPVLDPLGGLLVSGLIKNEPHLLDFYYIRGRKVGPFKHLDLILHLDPKISIDQAHGIEQNVRSSVKKEVPMVQEILIHLDAEKQPPHH